MQLIYQNQQKIIKIIFLNQKEKRSKTASRKLKRKRFLNQKEKKSKKFFMTQ